MNANGMIVRCGQRVGAGQRTGAGYLTSAGVLVRVRLRPGRDDLTRERARREQQSQ